VNVAPRPLLEPQMAYTLATEKPLFATSQSRTWAAEEMSDCNVGRASIRAGPSTSGRCLGWGSRQPSNRARAGLRL
jgi:hypothetical protein